MRVLQLIHNLNREGAQAVLCALARELDTDHYDTHICAGKQPVFAHRLAEQAWQYCMQRFSVANMAARYQHSYQLAIAST